MSKGRETLLLITVLAVGCLMRLLLVNYETEVGVDSVHYVLTGDNMARGAGWDTWDTTGGRWVMPPMFPLLIAIFRLAGFGLEYSGHLASVAAGTLLIATTYFLTRRLFGSPSATAAAWIAAFTPILVDYSAVIMTELLFAAFTMLMIIFCHRAFSSHGAAFDAFWSGVFAGLAFLTKTFGILLLPFLLAGYLFARGGASRTKPSVQLSLALIGFLLLAVPYWLALHQTLGKWVIDGKGIGQQYRIRAESLEAEHVDPRYAGDLTPDGSDYLINAGQSPVKVSQERPTRFLLNFVKRYVQKLIRIYQDFPFTPTYPNNVLLLYLFPAMLLGLGVFGTSESWRNRPSDRFLLYWLIPFVFVLPLIFVEVRYYVPVVALLIPFMARGAVSAAQWVRTSFGESFLLRSDPDARSLQVVIAVFILLALPKISYKITNWDDPMVSYNPRKVAAEWLRENGYCYPEKVMEYGHSVSFYLGTQSILIPRGDIEDVIRIARKYGTRLISLDQFYMQRANRRPELDWLFSSKVPPPPGLERIYSDETYPGLHHYIYRIDSMPDTATASQHGS